MGVTIYWFIVIAVITLGLLLPQEQEKRKRYIGIIAFLHFFVCGFRYMYLTGDLRKYASGYYMYGKTKSGWFNQDFFCNGRNAGFQWLSKFISIVTNGDFQIFLIIIAIITQVSVAIIIYYYSPKPWLSFLIFNCMSFYITYDFSAIKQGFAMSLLLFSMIAIFEKKPKAFIVVTLLAGFVHFPALVFLPAYIIANNKLKRENLIVYVIVSVLVYAFRNQIVQNVSDAYYDNEFIDANVNTILGGRFFVIVLILLCGLLLKGFREKRFEQLFNIIFVGAIIQMFSGFDNVFTRFADYYLQFLILFIPMIFYKQQGKVEMNKDAGVAIFPFDEESNRIFVMIITVILIWYYYKTCLSVHISYSVDDYLNYRFMWQV